MLESAQQPRSCGYRRKTFNSSLMETLMQVTKIERQGQWKNTCEIFALSHQKCLSAGVFWSTVSLYHIWCLPHAIGNGIYKSNTLIDTVLGYRSLYLNNSCQ